MYFTSHTSSVLRFTKKSLQSEVRDLKKKIFFLLLSLTETCLFSC